MRSYTVERTLVGRLPAGCDLLDELHALCRREGVRAGQVQIIGALQQAELGWYDEVARKYEKFRVETTAELLSCTGNVSALAGEPFVHLHALLAVQDRPAVGGHVSAGCRGFVGEYALSVRRQAPVGREGDAGSGLPVWQADALAPTASDR